MARVGYYDMARGAGKAKQVDSIEVAGDEAVNVRVPDAETLAGLDVLVVQNPLNNRYGGEYLANLEVINQAVANGLTLIIHDRYVENAEQILPGGESFNIVRDFKDSKNIELADDDHAISDGLGGVVNDASLDRGNHSSHGYAEVGSLPANAEIILTTGDPNHAVTFAYDHGEGLVIYSTIPLDHYLGGKNELSKNLEAYAANLVEYATEPRLNEIAGTPDEDILIGTERNDKIEGHGSNDLIDAGLGDDIVYGNTGDDNVTGGDGNDWVSGGKQNDIVSGGDGDDELFGNTGNDQLFGGDGDDHLFGNAGNDRLDGGSGQNTLDGGSGDDVFVAGVGNDNIDGGSGSDLIDLGGATGTAKVDLSKNAVVADGLGTVSITSVEGVIGTDFADVISGSKHANVIAGGDGNDWIRGKEGADVVSGGGGADTFFWHRKDVVDGDGNHLGVDTIEDFDSETDMLDFTGLIKATKFDNVSEVVVLEEGVSGTVVSVYAGSAAGQQQVVLLDDVFGLDVNTLYDSGAILA